MGHTIVGVFRHSGDADLAAAHLQLEYTLMADELDVIGETEWEGLTPPLAGGPDEWILASLTGIGLQSKLGDEDPVGKRWSDKVWDGNTLVVARTDDGDRAEDIAKSMREAGADRIDLLPH